jgi:N6-adenosine-specific RNA methylase IME4
MNESATLPKYQLLPPLQAEDFARLKRDIAERGVQVPIELDEHGQVLDGHHRLQAIQELRNEGVELPDPPVIARLGMNEAEKRAHVRSLNLNRRHLTAAQRRAVIAEQLTETPDVSDRSIAAALSVSPTTVGSVRRQRKGASSTVQNGQLESRIGLDGKRRRMPTARALLAANGTDASRALDALKELPVSALPSEMLTASDARSIARVIKRESSREERIKGLREPAPLTRLGRERYAVIYADPPWRYEGASDPTRVAENHYETMSHEELLALPVGEIAARSSVLFLWATPPKVAEAVALIDAWGFRYTTIAIWDKGIPGLGSWYRQQHELLLIATRGAMPAPAPRNRSSSVIKSPRGRHSAKPAAVRQQIERMFPDVPRVELFARGAVEGWDVWGAEARARGIRSCAG